MTEAQKEYIITDEQKHKIYKIAYTDHDIGVEIHRILDEIRSHPHESSNKLLDDIAQYIQKHSWTSSDYHNAMLVVTQVPLLNFIQELRSQQKEREQR